MSPVYGRDFRTRCEWIDLYDDWSLAPDVNPVHRVAARRTYDDILRGESAPRLVTCNSEYMARRTGTPLSHIVPNGVDDGLADLPLQGDPEVRLIVQGYFFRGRTDFKLLDEVVRSRTFEEVLICAPGAGREMTALLRSWSRDRISRIVTKDWVTDEELARIAGPNTTALIPHLVRDYTLSQDLMKAYKYLALGIPVVAPRLLWPRSLSIESAFLTDFGDHRAEAIGDWVKHCPKPTMADRRQTAEVHGWKARAARILSLLETAK